ncbi:nucleolar protein 6-like [Iris pallida]|uniref:Nucleolar protein 6-like n=1 Tax=Iris pallida TaxID=29817 RepID=A0AAX6I7B6_IRIPA|nr:nucleolar protein 6-like [Iris pallida]
MFLATTYDKVSEAWTKLSPNKLVLKRIASYAQSSADLLTNLILHGHSDSYTWECLVRTPLNNYDAIVLLHRDKLCYPQRLLFPTGVDHGKQVIQGKTSKEFYPYMAFGNALKSLEEAKTKLMVDFDPTNYFLEDLKASITEEFPDTFKVWYDSLGGDAIGLTWERKGTKKRSRDDAEETRRDPVDILKGLAEVGKGFVKSIYLLKAPKTPVVI